MYQIDSLKEEINKKIFAKADSIVDRILICPRIKLLYLQSLILTCVESGVLLSNDFQQMRQKNAGVPDLYFTLLDAAGFYPTLTRNQNAKAKEREIWVTFTIWISEAARAAYTSGAASGSVHNLVKSSNLPVSKVRQILHWKVFLYKNQPGHT